MTPMRPRSKRPFEKRLTDIVSKAIAAPLRSAGFRKSGPAFLCKGHGVTWFVDVQRSRENEADRAEFTVNVGVYRPGLVGCYLNRKEPKSPSLGFCCISARLGMLSAAQRDVWWVLESEDDAAIKDAQAVTDLTGRIQDDALPFFERFHADGDVQHFLEKASTLDRSPI